MSEPLPSDRPSRDLTTSADPSEITDMCLLQAELAALRRRNAELEQELTQSQQLLAESQAESQALVASLTAGKSRCLISEAKLSNILSHALASITSLRLFPDRTLKYDYFSAGCETIFGYTAQEFLADPKLWLSRVHLEDLKTIVKATWEDIQAERSGRQQYRFYHKDGSLKWISTVFTSEWDAIANCWVVTAVDTDITDRKEIELALQESELRLHTIVRNSLDGLLIVDPKGMVQFANPAAARLFGKAPQDLIGHDFGIPIGQEGTALEVQFVQGRGKVCFGEISVSSAQWAGELVHIVSLRDISDRKQAENALSQREQEIRALVDNSPDIMIRTDLNYRYLYVNPKFTEVSGLSASQVLGKTSRELGYPEDLVSQWHNALDRAYATLEEQTIQYDVETLEGPKYYFSRIVPELDENGQVVSGLAAIRDITARRVMELSLQRQTEQAQTFNQIVQAIRNSLDLETIFATSAARIAEFLDGEVAIVQYQPDQEQWVHLVAYDRGVQETVKANLVIPDRDNPFADQLKRGQVVQIDDTRQIADPINQDLAKTSPGAWLLTPIQVGNAVWGSLTLARLGSSHVWQEEEIALALRIADQLAIAIHQAQLYQQVQQELADRKQAEEQLKFSRARFAGILEIASEAIISVNADQRITLFNRGAEQIFGYTAEEILGQPLDLLMPDRFTTIHRQHVHQFSDIEGHARRMAERSDIFARRKDGTEFPAEASISKLQIGDEVIFTAFLQDITARKVAEAALQELNRNLESKVRERTAQLHLALTTAYMGYWEWDMITDLQNWSPENYTLLGYQRGESGEVLDVNGQVLSPIPTFELFLESVHPDDRDYVLQTRKVVMADNKVYNVEHRVLWPDGSVRWRHTRGGYIFNDQGQAIKLIGVSTDITQRKQTELRLQQQVEAEHLLAAISQTINQSVHLDEVLVDVLERTRLFLQADRVLVYRFLPDWSGAIELEAVSCPELALSGQIIQDPCFNQNYIERYRQGHIAIVHNRQTDAIPPCYANMLAQMQVQANLVVPILQAEQVWGLLIAHQCDRPRTWQEAEIDLLNQLGLHLGIAGQKDDLYQQLEAELAVRRRAEQALAKQVKRERFLKEISQQLRKAMDVPDMLATTVTMVREFLQVDRALIFQVNPDRSGIVVQVSALPQYIGIEEMYLNDEHFPQESYDFYLQGEAKGIDNVETDFQAACLLDFMHQIHVKSKIVASILQTTKTGTSKVWGLLVVHACTEPRQWQSTEVDLLQQLAYQLGIAIRRAELYDQLAEQLAQREVLLKEIHHRVKNNLQIISSLMRMQSRQVKDNTTAMLFREAHQRVLSMSLIHEQLYQSSNFSQIEFGTYLKNLVSNLFMTYGVMRTQVTHTIEANGLTLDLNTAIPCGLIVNELVSNALKYAFPENRTGQLIIRLEESQWADGSHHRILSVIDDGIGVPEDLDWEKVSSLGLKIVRNLSAQLKGRLELERHQGTTFRITFPAE